MKTYQGVTYSVKAAGGTIRLTFTDPVTKTQRKVSTGTPLQKAAEGLASDLSQALECIKTGQDLPSNLNHKIYSWLGLQTNAQQLVDNISKSILAYPIEQAIINAEVSEVIKKLEQSRNEWRERAIRAEAALDRQGLTDIINAKPISLKQALEEWLKPGGGCTLRQETHESKKIVSYLKDFVEQTGEKQIGEVTPEDVTTWLKPYITKKRCDKRKKEINRFLSDVTSGKFNRYAVDKWFESSRKALPVEIDEEWFWLTKEESSAIIAEMSKESQYWADAAALQYHCGFRPEELAIIRKAAVVRKNNNAIDISLKSFKLGGEIRTFKTTQSQDAVQVPDAAKPIIERRLLAKDCRSELLFPPCGAGLSNRNKSKDAGLWPSASNNCEFSEQYLKRLRKAAKSVMSPERFSTIIFKDGKKREKHNIVSRSFRYTCCRELAVKYGIEHAAKVLRDEVQTVRNHYADLVTSDFSTER